MHAATRRCTRCCTRPATWGYTFRLGSARAYVERDADAAWAWLRAHGLVDDQRRLVPPAA